MSYRDFDAFLREKSGGRPEFIIGGQKFTCRAKLPWKKFSAMMLSLSGEDASAKGLEKTEDFFKLVLIQPDRQRFLDLLNYDGEDDEGDEENVISPSQVGNLLDWLLAYYTDKDGGATEEEKPTSEAVPNNVVPMSLDPKV